MVFDSGNYFLGIALPPEYGDVLNSLIIKIAELENSLSNKVALTSIINVKPEFHVTLGVFHSGIFGSNKVLFENMVSYLRNNKDAYHKIISKFIGTIKITGIGFDADSISGCTIVWASVESQNVSELRKDILDLLLKAGLREENFVFNDPHITLFMKTGKKDRHDIRKPLVYPIKKYGLDVLSYEFHSLAFYRGSKVIATFGKEKYSGTPATSFKTMLNKTNIPG